MNENPSVIQEQNEAAIEALTFMIALCIGQQGPIAVETMIENLNKATYKPQSNIKQERVSKIIDEMVFYLNRIKDRLEEAEHA